MNSENFANSMYFTADHYSEDDDDSGDNYYTSLIRDQIETHEYTSILLGRNISGITSEDYQLSTLSTLDESTYSNYQKLSNDFTNYITNTETEAFRKLDGFSKTKEAKFLTYDQAIEKVLDKIDLEVKLERLIKSIASFDRAKETKQTKNENYYSSLANFSSERKARLTPELLFLEHIFCLAKFSKLGEVMKVYDELFIAFFEKLSLLVKKSQSDLVVYVGKIFINLFKNDWKSVVENYKQLLTSSKWNVLKNLIYFSFKIALFQLIDLNERGSKTSMGMILNSIYQYIKNIDQI